MKGLLEIKLFGLLELFADEKSLPPFPTQRSRELFAFLTLNSNRNHKRTALAGMFWSDKSEEKARASLSTELWRIKKTLGGFQEILVLERDNATLVIEPERVDALRFLKSAERDEKHKLDECRALYRGDLLEGCYSDWCLEERERFREKYIELMEKTFRFHAVRGEWREAILIAKQALKSDPLREKLHGELIKAYILIGERTAAIAQFQLCAEILKRELQVEPLLETQKIIRGIKDKDSGLAIDYWKTKVEEINKGTSRRIAEHERVKRFAPAFFHPRKKLDETLTLFEESSSIGLILTGPPGTGKTSWLVEFARQKISEGNIVLFYDAAFLTLDLDAAIARQINGSSLVSAGEAFYELGRLALERFKQIWLLFDDAGAFNDLGGKHIDLLRRIDQLAADLQTHFDLTEQKPVRILLTCRDHAWKIIEAGGLFYDKQYFFREGPFTLGNFTQDEARTVFEKSKSEYGIAGDFDKLSIYIRREMEYPLTLRMICEIYAEKNINQAEAGAALFREFLDRKVTSLYTRQFLASLVSWMAQHQKTRVSFRDLIKDAAVNWGMGDQLSSPFQQILDIGILEAAEFEGDLFFRIEHEKLFEFLLAEHYLSIQTGADKTPVIENVLSLAQKFPPAWGALTFILVTHPDETVIRRLAEGTLPEGREIVVDALTTLYRNAPAKAMTIIRGLFNTENDTARRTAMRCAFHVGENGLEMYTLAISAKSESMRRISLSNLGCLWRNNPEIVLRFLRAFIEEITPQTVLFSLPKIQNLTRILGWLFEYDLPRERMMELNDLTRKLVVEKLRLPRKESHPRIWKMIKKTIAFNSSSWPSRESALSEIWEPEMITNAERKAFLRTLALLRNPSASIGEESLPDLKILLEAKADALHFPAHHLLAAWMHVRPKETCAIARSLFDATNESGRLWILMSFYPLSAPNPRRFSRNELATLEELTLRYAEENSEAFFRGASSGVLADLESVAFLSLGLRYIQSGINDFPLLASIRGMENFKNDFPLIPLLKPIGLIRPRETVSVLDWLIDWEIPCGEIEINTLGALYSLHADILDTLFVKRSVSALDIRRIQQAGDIEKATYQASLIRSQDTRASSILIGSPYGLWLTDCVMRGYFETKNEAEASRRFGEGLFDAFRECDWQLTRLFGVKTT